jgi:hypothetical protein
LELFAAAKDDIADGDGGMIFGIPASWAINEAGADARNKNITGVLQKHTFFLSI